MSDEDDGALGKALCSTVGSVMRDLESAAQVSVAAQAGVSEAVGRLNRELDRLLEEAPGAFTMQYAGKISGVRKRVAALNSVLGSVQRRLDNMDRLISLNHKSGATAAAEE